MTDQAPVKVDTSVPHSARIWNYRLGGRDNVEADRMVGDQVMTDGTTASGEASVESMRQYARSGAVPYHLRSEEAFAAFFDGLDVVSPGIVSPAEWPAPSEAADIGGRCAVARIP